VRAAPDFLQIRLALNGKAVHYQHQATLLDVLHGKEFIMAKGNNSQGKDKKKAKTKAKPKAKAKKK
jgi:hypothetical protein